MSLSQRLRTARTSAGLTQDQVADHFGISRVSVTQWEIDKTRPDQDKFVELAKLYAVPLQWLMDGTGEVPVFATVNEKSRVKTEPRPKFLRSSAVRFYVRDWREFMGVSIADAARAAELDPDEYQAFETYPINFTLHQIINLADVIGVRGDQFWFPPPKKRPSTPAAVGAGLPPRKIRLKSKI